MAKKVILVEEKQIKLAKMRGYKLAGLLKDINKGIAELNIILKSNLIISDALKVVVQAQEFRHGGKEKDLGYLFAGTDTFLQSLPKLLIFSSLSYQSIYKFNDKNL
ncbi:MAG: hypothetical protein ACFFBZ_09100 [Promethearchaeota archaeon]